MVIEVLLQLLVGEVDAELLEAVVLHLFMHHDAHRHTAKRQREKEERAREKEREKTMKKTGHDRQDTIHVQSVGPLIFRSVGTSRDVIESDTYNRSSKLINLKKIKIHYFNR